MMLISAAQWNLRLEHEYQAMCAFPFNSLFTWKIASGQKAPRAKQYLITYRVKTIVKEGDKFSTQDQTSILITMSDSPGGAPTARIVDSKIPFLPNVFTSGNICLGDMYKNSPHLWSLVVNLGRVLAMDPDRTNTGSPANALAATAWNDKRSELYKFRHNREKVIFPHPVGY